MSPSIRDPANLSPKQVSWFYSIAMPQLQEAKDDQKYEFAHLQYVPINEHKNGIDQFVLLDGL